ncbi:hypothetical protein GCM10020295_59670 [Streptomyces cinereospinus]
MAAAGLTLETPLTEGESGTYRSALTPRPGSPTRPTYPRGGPAWRPPQDMPHRSTKEQRTWYVEARAAVLVRSSS